MANFRIFSFKITWLLNMNGILTRYNVVTQTVLWDSANKIKQFLSTGLNWNNKNRPNVNILRLEILMPIPTWLFQYTFGTLLLRRWLRNMGPVPAQQLSNYIITGNKYVRGIVTFIYKLKIYNKPHWGYSSISAGGLEYPKNRT